LVSDGQPVSGADISLGPGYDYLKIERGSGTWTFESDFETVD